jgi:hypothetical protein
MGGQFAFIIGTRAALPRRGAAARNSRLCECRRPAYRGGEHSSMLPTLTAALDPWEAEGLRDEQRINLT